MDEGIHWRWDKHLLFSVSVVSVFCDSKNCSMPGIPVHHEFLELTQIHVHWVGDANRLILCRPLTSCLQSCPALGSFQMSQLFASGGQTIGVSTSTSVLPMKIQNWFPLRWTGWIFLLSKGLSRVFLNTTVQKHQFCKAQLSLWSNSHIHTWPRPIYLDPRT